MENKMINFKMLKTGGIVVMLFMCFSIYVINHSKQSDAEKIIDSLNENTVEGVVIDSFLLDHSIMQVPLIITNRDSIKRIIGYIKSAEDYSISHPGVMWAQHVVIKSPKEDLIFNVYGSSMNGTFIQIVTRENEVVKTLRNDSLGIYFNSGRNYN